MKELLVAVILKRYVLLALKEFTTKLLRGLLNRLRALSAFLFTATTMAWKWNPFRRGPGTVQPVFAENDTTLLDLPREVRNHICQYLGTSDLQTLRLVCKTFQWEIENVVGVSATLHGPRRWEDWTLKDEFRFLTSFGSNERRRVKHNIAWIQNAVVNSLHLKRLAKVPFEPRTLLQEPFMLRKLTIEMEEGLPLTLTRPIEMLDLYNNLRTLDLSTTQLPEKLSLREVRPFRAFGIQFSDRVLHALRTSCASVVDLRVSTTMNTSSFWSLVAFRGLPPIDGARARIEYQMRPRTLKLSFPILLPDPQLSDWRDFLEGQDSLTDLTLSFGFLYWRFFPAILEKNGTTLRSLDLTLGNYAQHRTELERRINWTNLTLGWDSGIPIVPDAHTMDWVELLRSTRKLRTLRLSMSNIYPRFMERPHPTRNLSHLDLPHLHTIELHFVKLRGPDFECILNGFPSLRTVELRYWNPSTLPDFTGRATEVFPILAATLLGTQQFESIKLIDCSVRACPQEIRTGISNIPNYTATWPRGTEHTLVSCYFDQKNVFSVTRNQ